MTSLTELRAASDAAYARFEEISRRHYPDGAWGAYKAYDAHDEDIPIEVIAAMIDFNNAIHVYYRSRDGEGND